jgi:hypothetical protein
LDVSLNKLQAQESLARESIVTKQVNEVRLGSRGLWIEKQRNLVRSGGLSIGFEKADLSKTRLAVWIGWKAGNDAPGLTGLGLTETKENLGEIASI